MHPDPLCKLKRGYVTKTPTTATMSCDLHKDNPKTPDPSCFGCDAGFALTGAISIKSMCTTNGGEIDLQGCTGNVRSNSHHSTEFPLFQSVLSVRRGKRKQHLVQAQLRGPRISECVVSSSQLNCSIVASLFRSKTENACTVPTSHPGYTITCPKAGSPATTLSPFAVSECTVACDSTSTVTSGPALSCTYSLLSLGIQNFETSGCARE